MPSLVILGAGGFLGTALISSDCSSMPIKAVARRVPSHGKLATDRVVWFSADLLAPGALNSILSDGDIVINLVYLTGAKEGRNVDLINNVIDACHRAGVARFVHCSTAVVVGSTATSLVSEVTPCLPRSAYERTKWAVENIVFRARSGALDVGILRPTAIVGPGGQNLQKLARSLLYGNQVISYLRACVFGKRPMHLVPVADVVAALLHLATLPINLGGNVYIVSADDDPENDYQSIEGILFNSFGMQPRKWPIVSISPKILSFLLKLLGRSETGTNRIYDSAKLRATGYAPTISIRQAIHEFGVHFKMNK